jgi:clan AA aspartic protease (TIGR02281 family)
MRRDATIMAIIWLLIIPALATLYNVNVTVNDARFIATVEKTHDDYSVYRQSVDGHFYIDVIINGVRIPFLVDTGASKTIISEHDARKLGMAPEASRYTEQYETPNGIIKAAPVVINELAMGSITLQYVQASVSNMSIKQSILGMNVLSQLNINLIGNRMMLRMADAK